MAEMLCVPVTWPICGVASERVGSQTSWVVCTSTGAGSRMGVGWPGAPQLQPLCSGGTSSEPKKLHESVRAFLYRPHPVQGPVFPPKHLYKRYGLFSECTLCSLSTNVTHSAGSSQLRGSWCVPGLPVPCMKGPCVQRGQTGRGCTECPGLMDQNCAVREPVAVVGELVARCCPI